MAHTGYAFLHAAALGRAYPAQDLLPIPGVQGGEDRREVPVRRGKEAGLYPFRRAVPDGREETVEGSHTVRQPF